MEKRESPYAPGAQAADPAGALPGDMPEEIHRLLVNVKLAVDEIRARLVSKCKPYYTVQEVAVLVARSGYTIRRWIAEGRIKAIRVEGTGPRGRLLVPRNQLDALVSTGIGAAVPDAAPGFQEMEHDQ